MRVVILCAVWCGGMVGMVNPILAQGANCGALFGQKQYEAAGRCFEKQATSMGDVQRAPSIKKFTKGRLLRNAATSFLKAAKVSKGVKSSALYERSLNILHQYLNERLEETPERRKQISDRIYRILQQTNLSSVEILSNDKRAKVCIQGGGATKCKVGERWKKLLPAGNYTLSVTYPGLAPRSRKLKLEAKLQTKESFYPPQTEVAVVINSQHAGSKMTLSGAGLKQNLSFQGGVWKLKLAPGTYRLLINYPGAPVQPKEIQVMFGGNGKFLFQPPSVSLTINSIPDGAKVYINGIKRGKTPLQTLVPDGSLKIEVKKGCHFIESRTLVLAARTNKRLDFAMRPEAQYKDWLASNRSSGTRRSLGWVGLTSGLVILGLSAGGYVLAFNNRNEALSQQELYLTKRETPGQYADAYNNAASQSNLWMTISHAGAGVGALATTVGIVGLATSGKKSAGALRCQVPLEQQ